jgi:hypothetical protein
VVGEPDDIDIDELEFSDITVGKLADHGVAVDDVQAILANEPEFFRNLPGRSGTHVMLGPDPQGALLLRRPDCVRPSRSLAGYHGISIRTQESASLLWEAEMTRRQTDEEIIAEFDKLFAEGKEMEGLVPVKARVSKDPRSVFSVRLRFGELTEISNAAKAKGLSISEFMRLASLSAARGQLDLRAGEQRQALMAVREKAEELYDAVQKLDEDSGPA